MAIYQSEVEYYVSNIMAYADITDEGFTDSQWEDIDDIIMGIKQ